jgi:SpoVK/Ycf46/Vps4 family AAA+-type ATPase
MSKMTYFDKNASISRFFFIIGNTTDEFCTDDGQLVNIEYMLHRELQNAGYECIIFFDQKKMIYFFDRESKRLAASENQAETVNNAKPVNVKRNMASGPIPGRISVNLSPAPRVEESMAALEAREALHFGTLSNLSAFRQIDACMKKNAKKTAVVFNDAEDFISKIAPDKESDIRGYLTLGGENRNIMIFIFRSSTLEEVTKKFQKIPVPIWDDFFKNMICPENNNRRINLINIGFPNASEIRNLINYFRLCKIKNMRIKYSEMEQLCFNTERALIARNDRHPPLRRFHNDLEDYLANGGVLSGGICYEMLNMTPPASSEETLNKMIGLKEIKRYVKGIQAPNSIERKFNDIHSSRLIPHAVPPNKQEKMHLALLGNPGTGKSTIAALFGQIYYEKGMLSSGHVISVTGADLIAGYVGQTAIKTRTKIEEAIGGVLFIDEAYSLYSHNDTGANFGKEAIAELMAAMESRKSDFACILAGYPDDMNTLIGSNPGFERRITRLCLKDYDAGEMQQIFENKLADSDCCLAEDLRENLPYFFENWVNSKSENWGNAGEIDKLLENLKIEWKGDEKHKNETRNGETYMLLEKKHIPDRLKPHLRPILNDREEILKLLNSMVGLTNVKKLINKISLFERNKKKLHNHYLFIGNPGTGKTTIAEHMGNILRVLGVINRGHVVRCTAPQLISSNNLNILVKEAQNGILFIDEAHRLQGYGTVYGELLSILETQRENMCVICAGYKEEMRKFLEDDPGFKDRFDEPVFFEDYSAEELLEILKKMINFEQLKASPEYINNSLEILRKRTARKDRDFGNARYVKKFFDSCRLSYFERKAKAEEEGGQIEEHLLIGEDANRYNEERP